MNPQKPQQEMPAKFREYLQTIEKMESSYKTDCAIRLLELGSKGREDFVAAVDQAADHRRVADDLRVILGVRTGGHRFPQFREVRHAAEPRASGRVAQAPISRR